MLTATYRKHTLLFNRPAGTSRGILYEKDSWFLLVSDLNGHTGIGECSLLPGLSIDHRDGFQEELERVCAAINSPHLSLLHSLSDWPSIRFGLEMALADLAGGGNRILFPSSFTAGQRPLPINGLIWMGNAESMLNQIGEKLQQGFTVLKMKVGAIDFAAECSILASVREQFGPKQITLRLDANGAFSPREAEAKLDKLARYHIHSIEQPIAAGQTASMARLCRTSPIPIALDEELIGLNDASQKQQLLEHIQPAWIVLKPSLLGGFAASEQWISTAVNLGIGWWVTSALESNVGLNAIAQWTAVRSTELPQGLGTGSLYSNNIAAPLRVEEGALHYRPEVPWDLRLLDIEPPPHWQSMPLLMGDETLQGVELRTRAKQWTTAEDQHWQELGDFMLRWLDNSDTVAANTSGSTGSPKEIFLSKRSMLASARATAQRLGLYDHKSALLALSVSTVAGMMMVVRAMLCRLQLEVVAPDGNPMRHCCDEKVTEFTALVPAQVYNALQDRVTAKRLQQVNTLIVGGGDIPSEVAAVLSSFPNAVYHSYGMTETYSHIALRRVNGPVAADDYSLLPGVEISTDTRGCLVIDAPHLEISGLVTNDLVEHTDRHRFKWLGRYDHVVNRGGKKLIAEALEARLDDLIQDPFFIAALPHKKLGEIPVVMIEAMPYPTTQLEVVKQEIEQRFDRREQPAAICFLPQFLRVSGDKVSRSDTLAKWHSNIDDWIILV